MLPQFYDSKNAKFDYNPDVMKIRDEASKVKIKQSALDVTKISLILIDMQKDFCFPEGTLYVGGQSGTGAVDDSRRICEFIYNNIDVITDITTTLDSHILYQIFFPWFWLNADGSDVSPHTIINIDDVRSGKYKPNPSVASWLCGGNYGWLSKQVEFYCNELSKAKKYSLYLWPPHCLLGTNGHNLVGIINEAKFYHGFVRGRQPLNMVKGMNPLTENYSVFGAEVLMGHDGQTIAQRDVNIIKRLGEVDFMILAGEAGSHCVKSSIDDIMSEILTHDPKLASKVYIMEDCMSAVVVPGVADFTINQTDALDAYKNAGMNVVKSTVKIQDWPGIKIC